MKKSLCVSAILISVIMIGLGLYFILPSIKITHSIQFFMGLSLFFIGFSIYSVGCELLGEIRSNKK